jgi:hypothetical protein
MEIIENKFDIKKLIDTFIYNNIGDFKLHDNNLIKFRYEYLYNNKNNNIFIYLKDWNQLVNLYKIIPEKNRHFYEIIDHKCKFFLDLDSNCEELELEEWTNFIVFIKKILKQTFNELFDKDIEIIEYQSFPTIEEQKYSCHLIIPSYCFYAEDCKNICNMILNKIDNNKYKKIIDDKVYGRRRMLRIEGSTKINSDRKKVCIYPKIEKNINTDGLITNIENVELLCSYSFNINNKNIKIKEKGNKIIVLKQNSKKYNYTNNDLLFIKNNIDNIVFTINKWHCEKINSKNIIKIFIINYLMDNMIILKRIIPFYCPDCKRIHENQHPYIFMISNNLFFHCRRSPKPINISYLLKK